MNDESLSAAAARLAALLSQSQTRIVFAESCTAGLVSAALAQSPGVSQWHCGSAVTYREATKTAWLGISPAQIATHNVVSQQIANQMATGVLRITPEADIAASITGHLGPQAPLGLDGVVYIAVARRAHGEVAIISQRRCQLVAHDRKQRQEEAALNIFHNICEVLRN